MTPSLIVPGLRYRDADAAVDFLRSVLGFEDHQVFRDESGKVAHAELRHGGGVVMVAPALDSP